MLMWIFDYKDFSVKNVVEIANYEINIDEETNSNSIINVLKKTDACSNDIVAIKENSQVIYWGIIEQISNENGKMYFTYTLKYITNLFDQTIKLGDKTIIANTGLEDFLKNEIENNFTKSSDTFANYGYIDVIVKTHTKKQVSVSNVENGIYNFHTWMTNCTQNYNITYDFKIVNGRLQLIIEKKTIDKKIIDYNAEGLANYVEVFETNIISKVRVLSPTKDYTLYLKTDRTTTENKSDVNRAAGKSVTVWCENDDDVKEEALNTIRSSTYNHNISFKLYKKIYAVGTPIAIKTKNSIIFDTYISSISINQSDFIEYQCGNIRLNFIEKLLKERGK